MAHCGIGQELDLVHSLTQLIEYRQAPAHEHAAVEGWLDATRAAVQQPNPERVFEIGNCLGDGRLGHRETLCGLSHAPQLHDREQHVQVTHPDAATDACL